MTWVSNCPNCGKDKCRWLVNNTCEGQWPNLGPNTRISVAYNDVLGIFFFAEEKIKGWFFCRWQEVSDGLTRCATVPETLQRLSEARQIIYRK